MRRVLTIAVLAATLTSCGASEVPTAAPTPEPPTASTPAAEPGGDALVAIQAGSTGRAAIVPGAPTGDLVAGFNNAGFDILRSQNVADNSVLSPVSIGHTVLMARGAADSSTGASIDSALALPPGITAHDAWNAIDQMIAKANRTVLDINRDSTPIVTLAGRMWPAAGVIPDQAWVDLLATHHGSEVATIDVTRPEASRREVNAWVSDATEALIPELLPPGFINGATTLVLTDAVYFKAQWQVIFGKYGMVEDDFTLLDDTQTTTTFMRDLENQGARGRGDGWTAAEIPYHGADFSMLIIIPDEGEFEEVRDGLSIELLSEIDAQISPGPYELLLPRWEDDTSIDLLPWLSEIGAAPGNYPGIAPGSFIGAAIHAADIAVDEWGTVAAAATSFGFLESGPPAPELTVAADKPFLYVIRHNRTGLALFVGQVTNPSS